MNRNGLENLKYKFLNTLTALGITSTLLLGINYLLNPGSIVQNANAQKPDAATIIGGRNVITPAVGYLPIIVAGDPDCSGSAIDREWVLTVDHCNREVPLEGIKFVGGVTNTLGITGSDRISELLSTDFVIPCSDDEVHTGLDCKLYHLSKPLTDEQLKTIGLVGLITKTIPTTKSFTTLVVGSGGTKYDGSYITGTSKYQIQEVELTYLSEQQCKEHVQYWGGYISYLLEHCTVDITEQNKDSCFGDSGGQETISGTQANEILETDIYDPNKRYIVGLVSRGLNNKCGPAGGGYTTITGEIAEKILERIRRGILKVYLPIVMSGYKDSDGNEYRIYLPAIFGEETCGIVGPPPGIPGRCQN